jgi:excisionase family DNA binding protein
MNVEKVLINLLKEVRELKKLQAKSSGPLPQVLTYKQAAEQLSVGMTKLKAMVKRLEIRPCDVGKRKMIPLTEVQRMSQPAPVKESSPRARKRRSPDRYDPKAEAAKIRAGLKSKRLRP